MIHSRIFQLIKHTTLSIEKSSVGFPVKAKQNTNTKFALVTQLF